MAGKSEISVTAASTDPPQFPPGHVLNYQAGTGYDPPPPTSSVHTIESTGPNPVPPTYGEQLRESYPNEWPATLEAYRRWDSVHGTDKAWQLEHCRDRAWFKRNNHTGKVAVHGSACHLRWCPLCANSQGAHISRATANWYKRANAPKLLTLTLKSSDDDLSVQITRLAYYFRRLRRQGWFGQKCRGGVWFLQVTHNHEADAWHPHLHCLVDSEYLPQKLLSTVWKRLTGDSDIVDIRGCWSPTSASNHVARYATRPGTLAQVPEDRTLELFEALHGRRICGTWGSAKGIELRPKGNPDAGDWETLGTWDQVMQSRHHSKDARNIIIAWLTKYPLAPGITLFEPGDISEPQLDNVTRDIDSYYNCSLFEP